MSNQQIQWPSRMTMEEKLQRLQITQGDLDFYSSTFVKDRIHFLINEGQGWIQAKTSSGNDFPLSDNVLAYHLLGKYWVAVYSPEISPYLCLAATVVPDASEYFAAVLQWLQTPLIFFSERRQRIQFYAHLDFPIRTRKLSTLTIGELDVRGLIRGPVTWQHFPVEGKSISLPLGRDSVLLRPDTFKPLGTDLKGSIQFIRENLTRRRFKAMFPAIAR